MHRGEKGPDVEGECTKVFNVFKNQSCDRQIGDRRGKNSQEYRVQGPSRWLPTGPDLVDIYVNVNCQQLRVSVTDRRDFHHQICNSVGLGIDEGMLEGTAGLFCLRQEKKRRYDRLLHGDRLGILHDGSQFDIGHVWVAFKSIFQGDHAGVDLATESHSQLLQNYGLLNPRSRIQSHSPLQDDRLAQGLCIDDYFAVSVVEDGTAPDSSASAFCFDKAASAYRDKDLLGFPDKDVRAEDSGKVIGAYVS